MPWSGYRDILLRRWRLITVVILLDIVASGYLFARSYRHIGYQGCVTLYIADIGAPALVSAPSASLDTAGQLLAGETAANFFADDVLDVAQSQHVAAYISHRLRSRGLPTTGTADINGEIGGSRRDRTVSLCAANPNQASALAIARQLGTAMTTDRARFVGPGIAKRVYTTVVSDASVGKAPAGHDLLNLALRIILGVLIALGLALLWDAADPAVRDERDVSDALGVPVIQA